MTDFLLQTDVAANITIAKSLRSSFNQTQSDLLDKWYLADVDIIRHVREAQEQHKIFRSLMEEIKEQDNKLYRKEFLGEVEEQSDSV